jgi:hypothetical protein
MDEDELTDAERSALAGLSAESAVPAGLEDRVVESLRVRGLIAASPRRWSGGWPAAAAALALFLSGLAAGRWTRPAAPVPGAASDEPAYLLLLYPGPAYVAGDAAEEAKRVAEYGAWAEKLQREGRLLGAEKLGDDTLVLEGRDGPVASGEGPQGYFIVRARTLDEARSIARACPHLGHGGRVTVQVVDPT